jgi:hypothetical protein
MRRDQEVGMNLGDSGRLTERAGWLRAGLLVIALPQLLAGAWAIVDPRGWFDEFPGGGRHWLPPFGPYDEHLALDAGAGLFATSVLLILAAIVLERRVMQVALAGWLAFAVPHTAYHMITLDKLGTTDAVLNVITLGATILVPLLLLWLTLPRERGTTRAREKTEVTT